MIYRKSTLTVEDITNLFLYGTLEVPSNLVSESLIRPTYAQMTDEQKVVVEIDPIAYMATGGGRFALGAKASIVSSFLLGTNGLFQNTGVEQTFTRAQMIALGVPVNDFNFSIIQYNYGTATGDYADRAYIYGSGGFTISNQAIFVIDANGHRHIENYNVLPLSDNFDFKSDDVLTQIGDNLLQDYIDPSQIGRTVAITFDETIIANMKSNGTDYDIGNYTSDITQLAFTFDPVFGIARLPLVMSDIVDNLWESGITKFLGEGDKPILYGSDGNDSLGELQITSGDTPLLYPYKSNGVILIGGKGDDYLYGGENNDKLLGGDGNDILDGEAGFDVLKGGGGSDTYLFNGSYGTDVITDSDGQGFIMVDSSPMNSATKKFENIYKNEATGYIVTKLNGGTSLVLTKEGSSDRVIINDWSESNNLSISLTGDAPKAPTGNVMNGDFKKAIDDKGTPSESDDRFIMTGDDNNNYTADAQNPHENNALDLISGAAGTDVIRGLGGDDALFGFGGDDWIEGGSDDDVLQGGMGKDTLYGGAGSDVIYGSSNGTTIKPTDAEHTPPTNPYTNAQGSGFNWISGYNANDVYSNGTPSGYSDVTRDRQDGDDGNLIDGGAGDDFIAAGTGADYVHGGADKDVIWGMDKADILFGDAGNDVIYGDGNRPSDISNTSIVWTLADNHGDDIIDGGDGDDIILGQGGNDMIFGGNDNDLIWGDDPTFYTTLSGNDFLFGGSGSDQLAGGGGSDYLDGGMNDDTLYGEEGDDTLIGGAGADILVGGEGKDTIYFNIKDLDTLGGSQDKEDKIYLDISLTEIQSVTAESNGSGGFSGKVFIDLGGGVSGNVGNGLVGDSDYTYTFVDGSQMLHSELLGTKLNSTINLASADMAIFGGMLGDYLEATGAANASIFGGLGDDTLNGNDGKNSLYGGIGADILRGNNGDDILDGGAGNDTLYGGAGANTYLFGLGYGMDIIHNFSDPNHLESELGTIVFGEGIAAEDITVIRDYTSLNMYVKGTNDRLAVSGYYSLASYVVEKIQFADGTIWTSADIKAREWIGSSGDDVINGTYGDDTFGGGDGNDTLYGYDGDDVLYGNDGDDILIGERADDVLFGGNGDDEIYGDDGDDILDGGAGNDHLYGGKGNNTYLFGIGSGNDYVGNFGGSTLGNSYTIQLGEGISEDNITLEEIGSNSLKIGVIGTSDQLRIDGHYSMEGFGTVSHIQFADGTRWDIDTVKVLSQYGAFGDDVIHGTQNNDTIHAGNDDDVISGYEGDDVTYGYLGNDLILGYSGNDHLHGGDGDDKLYGGVGDDNLIGGDGNDVLSGGYGADNMIGGIGDDTFVVDNILDAVLENASEGVDAVQATITYTLGQNIENLTLVGNSAISGVGNELDNVITGNVGNNLLDGGVGVDTLAGGAGNDTYIMDLTATNALQDNITEAEGAGNDNIILRGGASLAINTTLTLATNLESLDASGTSTILLNLTGNSSANTLIGNAANNTINGGIDADTMIGGAGDDVYIVDNVGDAVLEYANEGVDLINVAIASNGVTYLLGGNVEKATLTNTYAVNLTGNDADNVLIGNSSANVLIGAQGNDVMNGMGGADTLIGGSGSDIYVVDSAGDIVTELSDEGTDVVEASVSHTLSVNVENLTLTGTSTINATGNALSNVLVGNTGTNILNGGLGEDTMVGGAGNDTYVVDNEGDVVVEAASAGTDTVQSSISYTLGANLERLILTDSDDINAIGNELSNTLTGNSGNNIFDGGAGVDTLVGGAGNDTYIVDLTATNTLQDTVTEAAGAGNDTIILRGGTLLATAKTLTLSSNLENLNASGTGTMLLNLTGNALANFLSGNTGNNTLNGGVGNDILQAGAGVDNLTDSSGNNLYDGGLDADIVTAGGGQDFLIGGHGNDTITTGTGYDVIAFNKGDGQDIINPSTGADNTISLGGDFAYSDLSLTKVSNNLILKVGATDQITLKDWYLGTTNKSVVNLQVIAESITAFSLGGADALRDNKVENFNFANMVATFDAEGSTANWQFTDARLTAHLQAGSDIAAIGGDLAYQYGKNSNLTGMGLLNAQSVISAASFGQTAQTLNEPSVWQAEVVKLG